MLTGTIQKMDQSTAQQLCAHQVITSFPDCIKQLLENSIDAGSTVIKIFLEEYGTTLVEIVDNGSGVNQADLVKIGQKGTSSKNKDSWQVSTLGFRGEALNAIAKVSAGMLILSNTEEHVETGLIYDVKGRQLIPQDKKIPKGTKVKIQNLFESLPVRRIQFIKKQKEVLKTVFQLIRQYAIAYHEISFTLINRRGGKSQDLIMTNIYKTCKKDSWQMRIQQILGRKLSQKLLYFQSEHIQGFLLDKVQSGSGHDNLSIRQNILYFYINRRPICKIPQLSDLLQGYYKRYNEKTKYMAILNLKVEVEEYDINLGVDKREVMIREQVRKVLLQELNKVLEEKVVEGLKVLTENGKDEKETNKQSQKDSKDQQQRSIIDKLQSQVRNPQKTKQKFSSQIDQLRKPDNPPSKASLSIIDKMNLRMGSKKSVFTEPTVDRSSHPHKVNDPERDLDIEQLIKQGGAKNNLKIINLVPQSGVEEKMNSETHIKSKGQEIMKIGGHRPSIKANITRIVPPIQLQQKSEIVQQIPITSLPEKIPNHNIQPSPNLSERRDTNILPIKAQLEKNLKPLTLQKNPELKSWSLLKKQNFKDFQFVGQFNHAFLLCVFNGQFYLVDQHASSQKTKFQAYLQIKPKFMQTRQELNIDPILADQIENRRSEFQEYGYRFLMNRKKLTLKFERFPVYFGKEIGKEEFLQMLEMKVNFWKLPIIQNTAATKACRTAVMIGDVLNAKQAQEIVHGLTALTSPWNCPHGRPTLIQLGSVQTFIEDIQPQMNFCF